MAPKNPKKLKQATKNSSKLQVGKRPSRPFPNKRKNLFRHMSLMFGCVSTFSEHLHARAAVTLPPPPQKLLRRFTPRARLATATPDVYAPSTDASTSLHRANKTTKNSSNHAYQTSAGHGSPPPFARRSQALHRFPHAVRAGVEHGKGALVHRADALPRQRRHHCFIPQHSVHVTWCVPAHPCDRRAYFWRAYF